MFVNLSLYDARLLSEIVSRRSMSCSLRGERLFFSAAAVTKI